MPSGAAVIRYKGKRGHPTRGGVYRIDHQWKPALERACEASGVVLPAELRPTHVVGRVTSITNGVRANEHGSKLRARAGQASFQTTLRYIALACECSTTKRRRSRNACSAFLRNPPPGSHHLR
jgi:hypothetical protein